MEDKMLNESGQLISLYSLYDPYLIHSGIKGMKWGVRRYQNPDGSLTDEGMIRYNRKNKNQYNPNYSEGQRLRDQSVYGKSGVKRINRSLNEGRGIQAARSIEAQRINSARKRSVTAGTIGSIVGGVAGTAVGYFAAKQLTRILQSSGNITFSNPMVAAATAGAVAGGMIKVGSIIGRNGGKSIGMIASGYSPSKFRYT